MSRDNHGIRDLATALAFLGDRDRRRVMNNTWAQRYIDGSVGIILHDTRVVHYRTDGTTELRTGGYRTVTTKDRINRFAPNAHVYQRNGEWFVDGDSFYEGVRV